MYLSLRADDTGMAHRRGAFTLESEKQITKNLHFCYAITAMQDRFQAT
jgi:hypothetical protein